MFDSVVYYQFVSYLIDSPKLILEAQNAFANLSS